MVALSPSDRPRPEGRGVVRRCAALGQGAAGDWSANFGESRARAGGEVFAAQAVTVAFERHEGNAGLNYRSVLAREVSGEEAELYRRPGHRRRLRRVRPGEPGGGRRDKSRA